MEKFCAYEMDKNAKWWRKVANYLALAFAALIMIFGLFGFRISVDRISLKAYRNANEKLRETNNALANQLSTSAGKSQEYEKQIEKLKKEIFKLQVENAALKAIQQQTGNQK